jgi:hypothetical protein
VKKQIQRLPPWRNSGNLIARNLWRQFETKGQHRLGDLAI